uniref:Uncharacterized protein n=1 Tax=Roseihalotalea indica TaxID=2867963 RepID=A0AA49GML4_9BACT|nr:hypothetical protein K4G66_27845 [Tunicatimonas sp. TK19036]
MQLLKIFDETFTGENIREMEIILWDEKTTVREIITARVEREVNAYNQRKTEYFQGLIQPSHTEQTLNGKRVKEWQALDTEKYVYLALDSFLKNRYFMLVDDVQADTLDQEITLQPDTKISFIKLTPLVGG